MFIFKNVHNNQNDLCHSQMNSSGTHSQKDEKDDHFMLIPKPVQDDKV